MVIFAVFFTLGVWWLQQQPALPDFLRAWHPIALAAALFLTLLLPRDKTFERFLRTVMIALLAALLGFFHAAGQAEKRLAEALPDAWQGRDISVVGVVAELPRRHERGLRFRFDVEQVLTEGATTPSHVYLSTYADEKSPPLAIHAGERWRFTVRLKQPHGTSNPGGFDFEAWMLERGCARPAT